MFTILMELWKPTLHVLTWNDWTKLNTLSESFRLEWRSSCRLKKQQSLSLTLKQPTSLPFLTICWKIKGTDCRRVCVYYLSLLHSLCEAIFRHTLRLSSELKRGMPKQSSRGTHSSSDESAEKAKWNMKLHVDGSAGFLASTLWSIYQCSD